MRLTRFRLIAWAVEVAGWGLVATGLWAIWGWPAAALLGGVVLVCCGVVAAVAMASTSDKR